ncbi:MAG: bifunctional oligoribonuclease/PAP phosphatase NrnA [Bacilli bacterium]|nr:bifunctional oligoribonuclease/PAP phosphatase NrnA [Bacilli bacterium]
MYSELIKRIKEFDTIVIARHIGVDPDALCSQLALRDSIKLTYPEKNVTAIGTGSSKFIHIGKLDKIEKHDNALLIVCDTPDKKRIDSANPEDFKYSIKIDHHPFVEKTCDLEIIEDEKTSACEIIMHIIKETELECNTEVAELLYMGLVSDSNRFLFNSTTPETFRLVAEYIEKYQINIIDAYHKLYLRPLNEVRLEGYISSNMKVTNNHLGYIVISDEIINKYGVDSASAGNMVNNYNFIKEIMVWSTITEDIKNNQYRVSIRSRGPEINKIAEKYNGGGHKMAAGVRVKTLDEAIEVIKELDLYLQEYYGNTSEGNKNDN